MKHAYTEEQKARRNRQWYESRLQCGHATLCPVCGAWTKSRNGLCRKHGGYVRKMQTRSSSNAVRKCESCGTPMPNGVEAKVIRRVSEPNMASGYRSLGTVNLCADCMDDFERMLGAWLS